jgi:hypothetical protein
MAWARYDDELPMNRKVAVLRARGEHGLAALALHVLANTWSRNQGTGGHVPEYMPEQLAGRTGVKLARLLEHVGMFDVEPGIDGWWIHDFDDYSDPNDDGRPAAEKRREISELRRRAGRNGGRAKAAAAKQTPSKPPSKPLAELEQTSGPVPVPDPVPTTEQFATSSSVENTPSPTDDDDRFARTLELIVDAKVAERNPRSPNAYRMSVRSNTATEDGELVRRMLRDGDPPEVVALFVLGHGETASYALYSDPAPAAWCDVTCDQCDGDSWIDTGNGLAPCPNRKASTA